VLADWQSVLDRPALHAPGAAVSAWAVTMTIPTAYILTFRPDSGADADLNLFA